MQEDKSPVGSTTFPGSRSCIWRAYEAKGLEKDTIEILINSLTESSVKQYNSHLKYWWNFCSQRSIDPYRAEDKIILRCLTQRFKESASYSTLNSTRAAIAKINSISNTQSSLLKEFFKGVFHLRPPMAKYSSTWDISTVLNKVESWGPNNLLNLHLLTLKVTILLALGSAFRVQSISLIKLSYVRSSTRGVEIRIPDKNFQTRGSAALCILPLF